MDSTTENYMLMVDLNFINEENTVSIHDINGIINGNGHTISNINLTNNNSLITNLKGTIENTYINNFNQEVTTHGGIITNVYADSVVNNVHVTDVRITKTGSGNIGGISGYATASTLKNSSINNLIINTEGNPSELYLGGIVGRISNSNIENCYIKGIQINDEKAVNSGIGGIAGYGTDSNGIKNCYTEGKIKSNNANVGGIVGNTATANIENCYSKVNISTTNNNVGGIIGTYSGSNINTISNNLSIGNIYTSSGVDNLNRILGDNINTVDNNYAYKNQLLNGYVNSEEKGATLLSKGGTLDLSLGDSYNYEGKEKGVLPKLYNTDGNELLPNQTGILLDDNSSAGVIDLEVESIEATKPNTTEAEISVRINNPNEVEIAGIIIEDMTVSSITRNVTQNGITNITVRTLPDRYYDNYKLTGIKYKTEKSEEKIKEVEVGIEVQFYKEIYTYEDWQTIEEGTYQNYRLMADIDFSGKTNIKNNITVNRLEAENRVYTLKNIELEFNKENTGLINNVKTSMKNIGFENITLINTAGAGSYFGVIAGNSANLENLQFKKITVDGTGISYVGVVGGETSGNIENIEMKEINIKGNSYTGGFIGNVNINIEGYVNNIVGDNVTVNSTGNYVGGMIGRIGGRLLETNNLQIENVNVLGNDYIGGLIGYVDYVDARYLETNNATITGSSYIGGIAGCFEAPATGTYDRLYLQTKGSTLNANYRFVGGITGSMNHGNSQFWTVDGTTIDATTYYSQDIGGLCGMMSWVYLSRFQVTDSNIITNGFKIGGCVGSFNRRCGCELWLYRIYFCLWK